MRKLLFLSLIVLSVCLATTNLFAQNTGIGTTSPSPNALLHLENAGLDLGLLLPNVDISGFTPLASDEGMMVYDSVINQIYIWDGLAWQSAGGGAAWDLTGNAGTIDGTNFIGTTDNVPLSLRVNNFDAGRIESGAAANTFYGLGAGQSANNNINSTAFGSAALISLTTGDANSAFGRGALNLMSTGTGNVALGFNSLFTSTNGVDNVAIGFSAMVNATGDRNVGVGAYSGQNLDGFNNTILGYQAMGATGTRFSNTAIGFRALLGATIGSNNVALGQVAGQTITIGSDNTFIGSSTDASVNNLTNATAIGANTIVGSSNSLVLGNNANVGIGISTPAHKLDVAGGNINVDLTHAYLQGGTHLISFSPLNENIRIGANAAPSITTGNEIIAIGNNAGLSIQDGGSNIAIGEEALRNTVSGAGNIGIGRLAMILNNGGSGNVALGPEALHNNSSGNNNVGVGADANYSNSTGDFNTAVGGGAGVLSPNLDNATAIGGLARVNASNSMVLGMISGVGGGFADVSVGIGTPTPNQNASLDLGHSDRGLQVNRVDRTSLSLAASDRGMTVYDSVTNELIVWNGTAWESATGGASFTNLNELPRGNGSGLVSSNIYSNGTNISINTSNFPFAETELLIADDNDPAVISLNAHSNTVSDNARLFLFRSRGTEAAPLAVQNNDWLGTINFTGYSGALSITGAGIYSTAAETWSPSSTGAYLAFRTTDTGSTGSLERMRITDNGSVGIGESVPNISPNPFGAAGSKFVHLKSVGTPFYIIEKTDATTGKWGMTIGGNGSFFIQEIEGGGNNVLSIEKGAIQDQLYLEAGGNVGIGNNAPSFPLDVSGNINISSGNGLRINGQNAIRNVASSTYVGQNAGSITSGGSNTFVGGNSGGVNTTGFSNTFLGFNSALANVDGNSNTFLGTATGQSNINGSGNTFVGLTAGFTNTTGNSNTAIGFGADVSSNNLTNATAIGANASVDIDNALVLGNNANVGIGVSAPTEKLQISSSAISTSVIITNDAVGVANTDGLLIGENNAGVGVINNRENERLLIGTNGNLGQMLFEPSGNVGIGQATPLYRLDVFGAMRTGGNGQDGQMRIYSEQGATDFEVIFDPNPAMTANTTYTLPPDDGAASDVLTTDGNGLLSWGSTSALNAGSGLNLNVNDLDLGGALNQNTIIAQANYAFTVGVSNTIAGPQQAEIILGNQNTVTGFAGIAIGTNNTVTGNRGIAIGSRVEANHLGAIVMGDWSASSPGLTASSTSDQFTARFNAGYRFYATSDPIANPNTGLFINNAGQVGLGTFNPSSSFEINSTDALVVPDGTNAQRPAATVGAGAVRYNTDIGVLEYSDGTNWHSLVPPGTMVAFGGTTAPEGWLLCNGAFYDRTTYSKLFAAIGSAWGTTLATNFRVPDARGKFLRGVDAGANYDPDRASRIAQYTGGNGGDAVGSLQFDAFQNHQHQSNINHNVFGTGTFSSQATSGGAVSGGTSLIGPASNVAGNRTSAETRPVNVYVNYIIKY